ncbi:MAG: hypothetical protein HOQ05_05970, partial [Corynebacteriales bacterium]|nr:hypothetical protein [Mycobacteriales bacterium]
MQTIQLESDAAESAEKSVARRPVSWEMLIRLNPVHGRAVSAVTVSVFGVVLLAVLCLRVTNWNSTQATRLFIAMPLSTVFRTMALVALPAVFVALFLLVPWLFGSFVAARYFARRRRIEMEQRWIKLRKYHIGVPLMLVVVIAVVLAGFAVGQDWPADRLFGYAAAIIVSFS